MITWPCRLVYHHLNLYKSYKETPLKWKRFKQKWSNYEIATGVAAKESSMHVATLLMVIGEESVEVYNTFTWDSEGDALKIGKVLEKLEAFCNPRKNTIYEHYVFFLRKQENEESINHYVTILKNLADTCEFETLKESLSAIRSFLASKTAQ